MCVCVHVHPYCLILLIGSGSNSTLVVMNIPSTSIQTLVSRYHSSIKELELFDREGNGTPLQYSCLENPMDAGAC